MDQVEKGSTSEKSMHQCYRLKDKVAVLSASTYGMGLATARRFAQEGAKVVISSRKEENVKKAVKDLKSEGFEVTGVVCDVENAEDRKKLLNEAEKKYGGLDVLFLNAGVVRDKSPLFECTESDFSKTFDLNVKSNFLLMKEAVPMLRESTKSPSIILISSMAAYQPWEQIRIYSISKTALLALCRAAADELVGDGIRVNCIAPGVIRTIFSEILYKEEEVYKKSLSKIPMNRLGTPEEIASVAAFLASDDASYITGETIAAGGGMRSRH